MGYNLYIGEFEPEIYEEERSARGAVRIEDPEEVGGVLNSSDRYDNQCWPSYIVWHDFCEEVGLLPEFYGGKRAGSRGKEVPYFDAPSQGETEGLLYRHPGAAPLTRDHLHSFVEAKLRYEKRPEDEQDEYVLRRLNWLCWWTEWALRNCEYPTFANS